ncbi:MAG: Asp23/Gls24 family envelope stress response protein [Candidatus Omnitrophica bacterium CG11_big_fil_rev_8_21_14_0_20_64_10]|nr:MAG: Asp23/Gls24 family envelope stress response protein [Candidatus Omnitrophica bacterium CG11_big_fil_rev_8_21_14_0_20_64_10]
MARRADLGTVQIRNEVIGTIAAMAAVEVEGVIEVWKGGSPWSAWTGRSGVRVETQDQDVRIWLDLVVAYGANLPETAGRVQDRVREMVERMTQLNPLEVNVSIHHVQSR